MRKIKLPSKQEIERTFLKNSVEESAFRFNVSKTTFNRWLSHYNITTDIRTKKNLPKIIKKIKSIPPKKEILSTYRKNILGESAKVFSVSRATFQSWLKHYNIPANKKPRDPQNKISTHFPKLAIEYSKTNIDTIDEYPPTSSKRATWRCSICENIWTARIIDRTRRNSGCPKCKLKLEDDRRRTEFIEHANQRHGYKYLYSEVGPVRNKQQRITIICPSHGSFEQKGWDHLLGAGCKQCANTDRSEKLAERNFETGNNLAKCFPDLLKEWDYERNKINPSYVAPASSLKAHWICPKGHKYKSTISGRTTRGYGCKKCSHIVSKKEMHLFSYVKAIFEDAEWNIKLGNREIDILVPSAKICIEVDGYPWHSSQRKLKLDQSKNKLVSDRGYRMIRFREKRNPEISGEVFLFDDKIRTKNFEEGFVRQFFEIKDDLLFSRKQKKIWKQLLQQYPNPPKSKQLITKFPDILKYWSENNSAKPDQIAQGEKININLICKNCSSEYERAVPNISNLYMCRPCMYSRGRRTHGTPKKRKSIADLFPQLIKNWSFKNKQSPNQFIAGSHHKALWTCHIHGDFEREIRRYISENQYCPKCFNPKFQISCKSTNSKKENLIFKGTKEAAEFFGISQTTVRRLVRNSREFNNYEFYREPFE